MSLATGLAAAAAVGVTAALWLRDAEAKKEDDVGSAEPIDERYAAALDAADPLASFRSQFLFPPSQPGAVIRKGRKQSVYLCGNSLGLQPKRTKARCAACVRRAAAAC